MVDHPGDIADSPVKTLGTGELGGKARGLSLISETLKNEFNHKAFPQVHVDIPPMTVLLTGCFCQFMELNDLHAFVRNETNERAIASRFLKCCLPVSILGPLYAYAGQCHTPLAIRSSSLFEDQLHIPLAGVYGTKIIPNNQLDTETRFAKIMEAVKFVYATVYFPEARDYFAGVGLDIYKEQMAVIIQELVGSRHGDRFYPNISGVARSYHFYPSGNAVPGDGVVSLAAGLGKTIVDGGSTWTYSPRYPKAPPPYNSVGDLLSNTQQNFWAVNMSGAYGYDPTKEAEYLVENPVKIVEADGVHHDLVSTWDHRNDCFYEGGYSQGGRVYNFAPLLKSETLPINAIIQELLTLSEKHEGREVEIEFAAAWDPDRGNARVGFLQVRPMNVTTSFVDLADHEDKPLVFSSHQAMGNGVITGLSDVVFVKREGFDRLKTRTMEKDIAAINRTLREENRHCVLLGFGRWGSSDPSLGIPATWGEISQARVILEASLDSMNADMSQGSHFFHNLCALGIHYHSIGSADTLDWEYLHNCHTITETEHVLHVRSERPLTSVIDGRLHKGIVTR
ncbi:PEP/pyruvate-binding domain-containing protein [Myxococcota bacterium]|nr:PEP/pyruvate-binding domain-containing protein [Myxococcota bacterium]MBU1535043.1 PEP/pyruvate-binding domain-containing protein [Myxococcota bacterium]